MEGRPHFDKRNMEGGKSIKTVTGVDYTKHAVQVI